MKSSYLYETYLKAQPISDLLVRGSELLSLPDPEFSGSRASFAYEEWERSRDWRQILSEAGDLRDEKIQETFLKSQGFQRIGMEHPFHQPCPDWPEPYQPVADLQTLFQPDVFSAFQEAISGLQLGFSIEIRNLSSFLAAIAHRFAQYQHFGGQDFLLRFARFPFELISEGEISRLFDKWFISRIKPEARELLHFQSFLLVQVALLCHKANARLHIRTGMVQHGVSGYRWTLPEQPQKDIERFFTMLHTEHCLPHIFWQPSGSDWTNALRLAAQFTDKQHEAQVQVIPDLGFPFSRQDFRRWLDQLYAEGLLEKSVLPGSSARNLAQLERNFWMRKELCAWWEEHPFLSGFPEEETAHYLRKMAS